MRPSWAALGLAVLFAACGGGGGSSSTPSNIQVLLNDGDTLPGGFVVNTIESANMSDDRTVALIASEPGTPTLNGVFLRTPDGNITPLLTPSSPGAENLPLTVVRNLVMSGGSADISFEVGADLDNDTVFLYSGGQLRIVAQTGDASTPPGFRLLGDRRIADQGRIAFAYGTSPCTVDSSGDRTRTTCAFHIQQGDPAGLSEVAVSNDLSSETTSSITILMTDNGHTFVGLPGSGKQSLVGQVSGGTYHSLMNRGDSVVGIGTVLSAKPRAANGAGAVVIDARFDTDGDNVIDQDRTLLLTGGSFQSIAQTGVPAGTKQVLSVRGNGVDDRGRVVYTATFGDPGATSGAAQSLRIWDGAEQEIAFEGQPFGQDANNNDVKILQIDQLRTAANGDVVFLVSTGFNDKGTTRVSDTRILRWADGQLSTVLTTGQKGPNGALVELAIADLNENGDILVIAGVNRRSQRSLLLVPRS